METGGLVLFLSIFHIQCRSLAGLFLLIFLICPGTAHPPSIALAGTAQAPLKEGLILAFGDSLTAGLGVAIEQAYPAVLGRRLRDAGFRYQVINAGVSGETTAGGLRRLDWVLKRHQPDIVILELGANDGLRGLNLQHMENNLSRMIERFQKSDIKVILAGMKIPPNYGKKYTQAFENVFFSLADRYKLSLIPFFLDGVAANPDLNQRDGIHPTAKGYEVVIDRIFPIVEGVINGPP